MCIIRARKEYLLQQYALSNILSCNMDFNESHELDDVLSVDAELGVPPDPEEPEASHGGTTEAVAEESYQSELRNHPRFAKAELEAAITEQLSVHQHFVTKDSVYDSGLPVFDDCTVYHDMDTETERRLHKEQLELFMEHLLQGPEIDSPFLFERRLESQNIPTTVFDLEAVAELISCNLDICLYDSATHVIDQLFPHQEETTSAGWLVNIASSTARSSSKILKDRYVGNPVQARLPPAQKDKRLKMYCYPDLIDYICISMIRLMSRSISGISCLSSFLAILVRLSVKLKHLVHNPVQCAMRSLNTGRAIAFRLESAGANSRWRKETSYKKTLFMMIDSGPEQSGSSRYSGSGLRRLLEDSTPPTRYYKTQFLLRLEFANMIRVLLANMVPNSTVDNRITTELRLKTAQLESFPSQDEAHVGSEQFGFANVIHGNRIKRPFLFSNDRKNKTSSSSRSLHISFASHACLLAIANFSAMEEEMTKRGCSTDQTAPDLARIEWAQNPSLSQLDEPSIDNNGDSQRESEANPRQQGQQQVQNQAEYRQGLHVLLGNPSIMAIQHMEQYISALVSCALASTSIVRPLGYCMSLLRENAGPGEYIQGISISGKHDFSISCSSPQLGNNPGAGGDHLPVSQAHHFWQNSPQAGRLDQFVPQPKLPWNWLKKVFYFQSKKPPGHLSDLEDGTRGLLASQMEVEDAYMRDLPIITQCSIGNAAITVPCKSFVITVGLLFLGIFALVIIVIATLHNKIEGVDISNISILMWTIATLGLLLAKSWFVHDWPWHDFLQGQVVCYSVSETCRITGVSEQSLLAFLLRDDSARKLQVTGPWNGLFDARRSQSSSSSSVREGFSIDRAFMLATVTLCGIMVLKVMYVDGSYLVCVGGDTVSRSLGFQYGIQQRCLMAKLPSGNDKSGDSATSMPSEERLRKGRSPLLFNRGDFGSGKVLGVYRDEKVLLG